MDPRDSERAETHTETHQSVFNEFLVGLHDDEEAGGGGDGRGRGDPRVDWERGRGGRRTEGWRTAIYEGETRAPQTQ